MPVNSVIGCTISYFWQVLSEDLSQVVTVQGPGGFFGEVHTHTHTHTHTRTYAHIDCASYVWKQPTLDAANTSLILKFVATKNGVVIITQNPVDYRATRAYP